MIKRLTRHGNSWALVIDRPILDLLKFDPEEALEITTDGRQLFVSPIPVSSRRKKFDDAQELAHKRFGNAFQKLAK